MKRQVVRHAQGVVHAVTPNQGNRKVLKNAYQVRKRLPEPAPTGAPNVPDPD